MQRSPLQSLDDALAQLLAQAQPLTQLQTLCTVEADGRVLAADAVSPLHIPPWDNSAMDGYALHSADLPADGAPPPPGPLEFPVTQRTAAGSVGQPLLPGQAARIFTGAPVPAGAGAVVMQEQCEVLQEGARVRVQAAVRAGQNIRRAGEDIAQGATVLQAGTRLTPAALGLAASIGLDRLTVVRRPRVALFSTGDELIMPGTVAPQQLPPGSIYNSNRFVLRALLQRLGCEVTDLGNVPDEREATVAALRHAAQGHDAIVTSGGVSVGEEDHLKPAVQALGQLALWQIAIKPGKPFAYGRVGDAHFLGLPGNPVASLITCCLLVRPFVLRLQGVQDVAPRAVLAAADFVWPRADARREFLRVRVQEDGTLALFPRQSSAVLSSTVWGDGVVDLAPGQTVARGEQVRYLPFATLLG